jgi:hypothetical protein
MAFCLLSRELFVVAFIEMKMDCALPKNQSSRCSFGLAKSTCSTILLVNVQELSTGTGQEEFSIFHFSPMCLNGR